MENRTGMQRTDEVRASSWEWRVPSERKQSTKKDMGHASISNGTQGPEETRRMEWEIEKYADNTEEKKKKRR